MLQTESIILEHEVCAFIMAFFCHQCIPVAFIIK